MDQQAIIRLHSSREWTAEALADVVSAVFTPEHELWSTDGDAIAITDASCSTPPIWFIEEALTAAPYYAAEIVGPRAETIAFAKACAREFAATATDVSIDQQLVDDPGWAARRPREELKRGAFYEDGSPLVPRIVDMPVAVLDFGPWISSLIKSAKEESHSLVIRTPESTTITPYMRRLFYTFQVVWIRETANGPVEALTGLPFSWSDEGLLGEPEDDRERAQVAFSNLIIRLQILHPLDDTGTVSEATERLLAATVGLPNVTVGRTEISRVPWDRELVVKMSAEASPEPFLWCVDGGPMHGTLDILPSNQGVLEDLTIELPKGRTPVSESDARALWDMVKEYLPLGFIIAEGGETSTVLVHESSEHAEKDGLEPWDGGYGYLGYLGGRPAGESAGEGSDASSASDEAQAE
ncbi:hypothetical protein DAD186_01000 [Dermabacter vaginalis]|uniref:Uncharacterized protein n=1 Tax=Dermabacter vaginalis TaxID=1630135 RepID=A0A1B0ZFD3_9MICO|nr:DUF6177 family protein [Dermabacter vaginalis]ANP26659.1 hypothetical protein DAD186_01000 [Dermabacter vaginalis]